MCQGHLNALCGVRQGEVSGEWGGVGAVAKACLDCGMDEREGTEWRLVRSQSRRDLMTDEI